ncbi:hypothetical protein ACROYT_G002951 [Oculina patagonica]
MGAIVSHRKGQRRISRVEQKAIAISAFSTHSKADENAKQEHEAPVQPPPQQNSSATTQSSTNIAVASWGEGIVGTSSHDLHDKGVISSRGVEREVKSSKDMYPSLKPKTPDPNKNTELYTGFATVTPIPLQPDKEQAAIIIQRHVRGYQSRKYLKQQELSAQIIQRGYRKYHKTKPNQSNPNQLDSVKEDEDDSGSDSDDDDKRRKSEYRKPWRESTVAAPVIDSDVKIGEKTKESFNMYQEDITDLKWKTEQQLEMTTMGDDYVPPRIVVIASNVPRSDVLEKIVRDDVLEITYDFSTATLQDVLDKIAALLEKFQSKSKARSIALVCQGGPGYFNPVKGKMFTKAKLKQDKEISSFWKNLGTYMTKLDPDQTKIHIIGNNVTGNKKGESLMKFLSKAMRPSKVKVESPLELGQAGREMLALYFEYDKYRLWKSRMHSKISFKL